MKDNMNLQQIISGFDEGPGADYNVGASVDSADYAIESDCCRTVDDRLERLQQYTTHLERLLLNRSSEVSELHKYLAICFDGESNFKNCSEQIVIHQARHAAMGEILGVIAHKWRQPLNSISLIIQNLVDAWKFGEMNDELMVHSEYRIMEQVSQLTRSIDDFRSFLDPVTVSEFFDPIESVKQVIALLNGLFSDFSNLDIQINDYSRKTFQATGCQNAFQQVIFNLLTNAKDAICDRQRSDSKVFNGVISVSFTNCKDDVVITIADNGGGIAASVMEHIFEPFYTTKHKTNGIGIGLYVSRLIIENSMSGSLWANNIQDGAFFGIRLPAANVGGVDV